jgi:hypothetical protein
VFVELRLNDLVKAAIDGGKTFVHLVAEAADLNTHVTDLIVHVGADVLSFFFDEARKLLELGFLFCHMQGSIARRSAGMREGYPEHGNQKKRARILEARIMRIGWDVSHGFREGRDGRRAGLSGGRDVGMLVLGSRAVRADFVTASGYEPEICLKLSRSRRSDESCRVLGPGGVWRRHPLSL